MDFIAPTPQHKYKVLVRCMCFNQAEVIEDALKGFVMQKTNFPFVALVVDDCSTDGTKDVISRYENQYPDIIKAIYLPENYYSQKKSKNPFIQPWRDACQYEALCEGDDFWTDAHKLQKQVDFLDAHPDYMMCCSDALVISPKGSLDWHRYDVDCEIPANDMIIGGGLFVQTCTCIYRKEVEEKYLELECTRKCHVGDYCWQILSVLMGKAYYMTDVMGVYRYQMGDSWTAKCSKSDVMSRVPGMRSEINMLQGLDNLSKEKYHQAFMQREVEFVYNLITLPLNTVAQCNEMRNAFSDVYKEFSILHKADVYLLCKGYRFFHRFCFVLDNPVTTLKIILIRIFGLKRMQSFKQRINGTKR